MLSPTPWSERLAFDVALVLENSGETLQEVLTRHNLHPDTLLKFRLDPVFLRRVEQYREEINEKGLTFRLKARAQAEELLTTSWLLIHDPGVSAAVKADLIKSTVKWAGLDIQTPAEAAGAGGGVRITINLGNSDNPNDSRVIEYAPSPSEEDREPDLLESLAQLA